MSKHTPGPWKVDPQDNTSRITISCAKPLAFVSVNNIAASDSSQSELRANAQLIASAPDLLEALKTTLNYLYPLADSYEVGQPERVMLDQALKAILPILHNQVVEGLEQKEG